jgi:hypothetical protein
MLAAAGITGKFPSSPTDLVAHGVKSLGGSHQIADITEQLRGELLNAAKAAALAAATSRVDALNDRLQGVTSPSQVSDLADQASAPVRSLAGSRSAPSPDDEDIYDTDEVDIEDEDEYPSDREDEEEEEDEYEGDVAQEDEEPEPEEEPESEERSDSRPRRRATRQETAPRSSTRRSAPTASDTGTTRRRRASASTRRAPVRRGR